jgi:hypothetical protein
MIKTAITAAFLGAMVYVALFVDLGGKSLVGHLQEIWTAPVVQQKVAEIKGGVKANLEKKLADSVDKAGKVAAGKTTTAVRDELTDGDRAELFEVLKKAGLKP